MNACFDGALATISGTFTIKLRQDEGQSCIVEDYSVPSPYTHISPLGDNALFEEMLDSVMMNSIHYTRNVATIYV